MAPIGTQGIAGDTENFLESEKEEYDNVCLKSLFFCVSFDRFHGSLRPRIERNMCR